MDENKRTLVNNTVSLLIIQIMNYIFPFITLPYLTRIFTVDVFGRICYAQTIIEYFLLFVMFGFGLYGTRQLSIIRDNIEERNRVYNTIFCAQWLLFFASSIILFLMLFFINKFRSDYYIYLLLFLTIIPSFVFSFWFYLGMEKVKFVTFLNFIGQILTVILIFTLVKKPNDYILWLYIGLIVQIIIGGISLIFRIKYFDIKHKLVSLKEIWENMKKSSQYFLTEVSLYLFRQINIVVLGLVAAATVVAYYTTAYKLFMAGIAVFHTLITSLIPYMSKNKDKQVLKKISLYVFIFGIVSSILMFVFAKPVVLLIFSEKYLEAVKILQIFSLVFVFNLFIELYGFPLLAAFGYVKETNSCYIFGAVYNVLGLLVLYLTKQVNMYSVAILAASTYLFMFLHRIYYVHKYKLLRD